MQTKNRILKMQNANDMRWELFTRNKRNCTKAGLMIWTLFKSKCSLRVKHNWSCAIRSNDHDCRRLNIQLNVAFPFPHSSSALCASLSSTWRVELKQGLCNKSQLRNAVMLLVFFFSWSVSMVFMESVRRSSSVLSLYIDLIFIAMDLFVLCYTRKENAML